MQTKIEYYHVYLFLCSCSVGHLSNNCRISKRNVKCEVQIRYFNRLVVNKIEV